MKKSVVGDLSELNLSVAHHDTMESRRAQSSAYCISHIEHTRS
jgi:hypothetical protein